MARPRRATDIERVAAVRRFNRFYTRHVGALNEALLQSSFSLTEGRVVYEIAQRREVTATALGTELRLDAGYLSRLLRSLEARRLVRRRPSDSDGRQSLVSLTATGRKAFASIDAGAQAEIAAMLGALSPEEQDRLTGAMGVIERLLDARDDARSPYLIRPHRPGDMGWITHRHGVLYAEEYGWDETFEALVAEIVAAFIREFKPRRERCWIAERDGEIVGSVFLVEQSESAAKLRLLYVEPRARGLGIGHRLVEECLRFARQTGYRTVTLWTNDVLVSARRIYEAAGFRLVKEDRHHSFGHDLVGQTWDLDLSRPNKGKA